jgi:TRAP-type C4-dicarboxylate transport system substrate-binding protein
MRSRLTLGLALTAIGSTVLLFAQAPGAATDKPAAIKLRVAHIYAEDHPWHKSFEKFRDLVQGRSDGTMEVQIYPNMKLGTEKECVSGLRQGYLDITTVSANGLEDLTPEVTFLDLLFLFKDHDHWQRSFDGEVGQRMTELIRKSTAKGGAPGFEVLGYWGGSEVNILSRKRGYETLADLVGVKIRIQDSPLQFDLWKALGANPMSLPMDGIRGALQDGVIDAVPLSNPTNLNKQYYQVAPHISAIAIAIIARPMLMSGLTWRKLSGEQRDLVRDAARDATLMDRNLESELSDGALARIKGEPGVKVYTFRERNRMRERLRTVQERYAAQLGLLDLLARIDEEWAKPAAATKAPAPSKK